MNAFQEGKNVEARAMAVLLPLLQVTSYQGCRLLVANKGRLALELQRSVGDVLMNTDADTVLALEIKAEIENRHGRLFLETWSNRCRYTPGWMMTCNADWLLYYFVESDELYKVRVDRLKAWAWHEGRIYEYPEKGQQKYTQLNDTWGRVVPITVLAREVGLARVVPGPAARHRGVA